MRQTTDHVRALNRGSSDEEEKGLQEIGEIHALREEAQGKREEVKFPVAVDTHRRLPRPLEPRQPGEPDVLG